MWTIAVSFEPVVAQPARRLRQRKVDLHLRTPVAEPACALDNCRRDIGFVEQPLIQLSGRDVCDHCALRADRLAGRSAYTEVASRLCTITRSTSTQVSQVPPWSLIQLNQHVRELAAASARDRHPALLHGDCDHLRHESRTQPHPARGRCAEPTVRASRGRAPTRTSAEASRGLFAEDRLRMRRSRFVRAGGRPWRRTRGPTETRDSVPSTPNARSAFGPKPLEHSRPTPARSLCALPSARAKQERDDSPSGNAVAVGRSVFRYSSPRAARSSPSSSVR